MVLKQQNTFILAKKSHVNHKPSTAYFQLQFVSK